MKNKYPTKWRIILAHGPNYWNSNWNRYMVGDYKEFKENTVTIEWEREIAPYCIEKKIEQKDVTFKLI